MPDFLKEFDPEEQVEDFGVPLRLNTSQPLIQLLSDPTLPESRVHSVLVAFYHHAVTTARHIPSTLDDNAYYVSLQTFLLETPNNPS